MRHLLIVGLLAWGLWGCTQVIYPEVITRCPMLEDADWETFAAPVYCVPDGVRDPCWL
jgi:hypothetical protein